MKWIIMLCSLFLILPQEMQAKKKKSESSLNASIKEKKKQIKQKTAKLKKKYDKTRANLKKHLQLGLNVEALSVQEKEEYLVYLDEIKQTIRRSSLEGYREVMALFEVDTLDGTLEALDQLIYAFEMSFPIEEEGFISFCGKYIGDDGLEYEDGSGNNEVMEVSFYSLPIHQWEKKVIEKIVTSMAEKSLAQLLLDRKEMEKRGDQIHHVHPLRFMAHVFSDSYLKSCMSQIRNNSFKWSNFIDGYAARMREEAASGNLNKHVEGFCQYLKADSTQIKEIVKAGNYEGLVLHLMER